MAAVKKNKFVIWFLWIIVNIAIAFALYGCSGLIVFEKEMYGTSISTYTIAIITRVVWYTLVAVINVLLIIILNKNETKKWKLILQFIVSVLDLKWGALGSTLFLRHIIELIISKDCVSWILMIYYFIVIIISVVVPVIILKKMRKIE